MKGTDEWHTSERTTVHERTADTLKTVKDRTDDGRMVAASLNMRTMAQGGREGDNSSKLSYGDDDSDTVMKQK